MGCSFQLSVSWCMCICIQRTIHGTVPIDDNVCVVGSERTRITRIDVADVFGSIHCAVTITLP